MDDNKIILLIFSIVLIVALVSIVLLLNASITGKANTIGKYTPEGMGVFDRTGKFEPHYTYSREQRNKSDDIIR